MKKRNDEDIKKVLGKLPSVEDRQSKEMLYQKVSSRVNTPKRKVAPWLFPGLATIAVLLVLAVFIPVFFSNSGMLTVEDSADRSNESAESSSATEEATPSFDSSTSESEEESAEIKKAEPSSEDKELPPEENIESSEQEKEAKHEETQKESETELDSLVLMSEEGGFETVSYPGKNAEVILPTLQKQQDSNAFSPERYGLAERAVGELEYEVDETEGSAVVTFPDGFTASGSAWVSAIIESIRWDLEKFQLEKISLQTESGNPVGLGSYGEMSEVPVIQEGEYIFQLYQYEGSSERFLAPISVDGSPTFQDALSLMKEKGRGLYVSPAIPEHVQFTSTTEEDALVNVNLQHEAWASEQQLLTMIEAILVTAGHFGFEKVKFNGMNVREFSTYDLEEPIEVPERINPIVE
ncbi:hypothetical protein GLV98_02975 [Halobacillus litoralis]|uniref:GerMN domain-containing protein n=1 Tax=Halobacillus litoralis TaxID=45668 RepID=A0A845DYK2_9BACI|nr:hypothetical protein [Halobacillus litoralis]MYL48425.1 hypothetical protein [Halobacillus litoralis]